MHEKRREIIEKITWIPESRYGLLICQGEKDPKSEGCKSSEESPKDQATIEVGRKVWLRNDCVKFF
jgi:hypothetical protein